MNWTRSACISLLIHLFLLLAVCRAAPVVCTWYEDKSAALSLTYDDNMPLQLEYGVEEMNKRNMQGTFFIIANKADWSKLLPAINSGHEIGGHSLTHTGEIAEVKPTLDSLKKHLPAQTWFTWAYPGGDTKAHDEVKRYTIAARLWYDKAIEDSLPADFHRTHTMGQQSSSSELRSAIAKKGWLVNTIHCISKDSGTCAALFIWSAYTAYLDTLQAYRQSLWIARLGDAARYAKERSCARITGIASDTDTYSFDLTDTLSDSVYSHPLTLKMALPTGWSGCSVTQGVEQRTVVVKDNVVWFNAVPDSGRIILHKSLFSVLSVNSSLPAPSPFLNAAPNPFLKETLLSFGFPEIEREKTYNVSIDLFDLNGRKIRTLLRNQLAEGSYSICFDVGEQRNSTQSGIYLCRMKAEDFIRTIRLIHTR